MYIINVTSEDIQAPIRPLPFNLTTNDRGSLPFSLTIPDLVADKSNTTNVVTSGKAFIQNAECYACANGVPVEGNCSVSAQCWGDNLGAVLTNMIHSPSNGQPAPLLEHPEFSLPGLGSTKSFSSTSSEPIPPPDWLYLLRGDIFVYCQSKTYARGDITHESTQGCAAANLIKGAIRQVLPMEGYSLAVSSAFIDPEFREYVHPAFLKRPPPPSSGLPASCSAWSSYNIYITSHQPGVYDAVYAQWRNLVEGGDGPLSSSRLLDYIRQQRLNLTSATNKTESQSNRLCDLKAVTKESLKLPTKDLLRSTDLFQASISPTVFIYGPGTSTTPDAIVAREAYNITVANFPNTSPINVMLIPVRRSSVKLDIGPIIATVQPKQSSSSGRQSFKLSWTPTSPEGEYYLKAYAVLNPLFASYSSVFEILDRG